MLNNKEQTVNDTLSALIGFLDLYSDRCTSHASFFVASFIGMVSILTLFDKDNIVVNVLLILSYILIGFSGHYFLLNFRYYNDYSESIIHVLSKKNRREIISSLNNHNISLQIWIKYCVYRRWKLYKNNRIYMPFYVFFKDIRLGIIQFDQSKYLEIIYKEVYPKRRTVISIRYLVLILIYILIKSILLLTISLKYNFVFYALILSIFIYLAILIACNIAYSPSKSETEQSG